MNFIQPNKLVLSECVCVCVFHPFSCACVRDIMRKEVLTSTLNKPKKVLSPFHVREMRIIKINLTFIYLGELQKFYYFKKHHLHVESKWDDPLESMMRFFLFVLTPFWDFWRVLRKLLLVVKETFLFPYLYICFRPYLILIFYFPTLTYTTFTLKTLKGHFSIEVRTCSLKYLPTQLPKGFNFVLFSKRIFTQNMMWV